jgi:hypothetical protein
VSGIVVFGFVEPTKFFEKYSWLALLSMPIIAVRTRLLGGKLPNYEKD